MNLLSVPLILTLMLALLRQSTALREGVYTLTIADPNECSAIRPYTDQEIIVPVDAQGRVVNVLVRTYAPNSLVVEEVEFHRSIRSPRIYTAGSTYLDVSGSGTSFLLGFQIAGGGLCEPVMNFWRNEDYSFSEESASSWFSGDEGR